MNDDRYASLALRCGQPVVYDITDDWLLAEGSPRARARRQHDDRELVEMAKEVVVCSTALSESRGRRRAVELIENGIDLAFFRIPQPAPADLPPPPRAVYVGTLHENRLDVDLCVELARSERRLSLVLVGPNSSRHRRVRHW